MGMGETIHNTMARKTTMGKDKMTQAFERKRRMLVAKGMIHDIESQEESIVADNGVSPETGLLNISEFQQWYLNEGDRPDVCVNIDEAIIVGLSLNSTVAINDTTGFLEES